nr:beta-galactosidase-1-like protein 2 isoform X10 [Equus caballus]
MCRRPGSVPLAAQSPRPSPWRCPAGPGCVPRLPRGGGSSARPPLLQPVGMASRPRSSPCLFWKRILCIFFLPCILSGFSPRVKHKKNLLSGKAQPQLSQYSRFIWSRLTPLELRNRSMGLQTESRVGSNPYFTLEGHKFLIFGGSIHYFRVPREYWRDRLLKLKACGFNTVTTRLLQDPQVNLRTTDKGFVEAVDKYFDHLISRVVHLQYRKGGPIIAVQVENEYGSFYKDKDYMPYLQQALLKRGIVELLLTSDNVDDVLKGYIKGVLATINMKKFRKDAFQHLYKVQRDKPIMIMEYWVGWFDTWGSKHEVKDAGDVKNTVSEFIKFEISFNVYMFHGGTNFGFINGAINFVKHAGVVTSYDYDAVLTEAGDYTKKYFKLRKLFGSILAVPLPPLPELTPKAVYPSTRSSHYLPLWDVLQYLDEPVMSKMPVSMENLPINNGNGQSYGLVLYETPICSGGQLHAHVRDVAQVFLNETTIGILDDSIRNLKIPEVKAPLCPLEACPKQLLRPCLLPCYTEGWLFSQGHLPETTASIPSRTGIMALCSSMDVTLGDTGLLDPRKHFTCLVPGCIQKTMRYLHLEPGSCDREVAQRLDWSNLTRPWLRRRQLGLQAKDQNFMLEDSTFWIFGGSVHYFRVPKEYWRDRLLKMKACGLNTLTTYVPWNLHEPERGRFDFSGNLDLEAFVLTAAEIGLWVILRPGPYICSEIDLGGLPSWLLQDSGMRLRTTYKGFTNAVDLYFDHLMPRVVPLQYKHGGPIIAVQVENEYGSYNKDPTYMPYIKKALEDRGIEELLLTSDNKDGLSSGAVDGVLATINLQSQHDLQLLSTFLFTVQGARPKMVMEYWTGWFDSWGGTHNILDSSEVLKTVSAIIDAGSSINLYMFHGGTNFGFINGAMHYYDYKSHVTSYDYDAVLTEAGDYTAKYLQLRDFFGSISGTPLPPPPDPLPKTAYESVTPAFYLSLWDALKYMEAPINSEQPVNMENLPVNNGNGQSFGYTLYETTIASSGVLSAFVRDRGQVFVNTVSIGFLDYKRKEINIPLIQGYTTLRILVENCGRVNYGEIDNQRKGLIGNIYLNDSPLSKFRIYSLDMKKSFFQRFSFDEWNKVPEAPTFPAFFLGALSVALSPSDTFMKLEGWEKGVVFINGQNLGRYWNIGPQETLYLPGTWLDQGINQVIVFEEKMAGSVIQFTETPHLGRSRYIN